MPTARTTVNNTAGTDPAAVSILQTQINQLGDRMEAGFSEIKAAVSATTSTLNQFMLQEAAARPAIMKDIEALKLQNTQIVTEQEAQGKQIKTLEAAVRDLQHTNKILTWILGVFTAILIAILAGVATGSLALVVVP